MDVFHFSNGDYFVYGNAEFFSYSRNCNWYKYISHLLFLICTYVISKYLLHTLWLKRIGRRAQGVVTEITYNKENAHTAISYVVEDKVYIHQHGWHNGKWKIGHHQLMIVYDPVQPENAYLEQYEIPSLILSDAVMAAATISSLILTFYCIFKF